MMPVKKTPNRLINEKSPYLLQHAHNPVDWYPWGDEAIDKARNEDKPIFLSVGYSTCYWCHVMEREVFENESIAHIMNERMVNIKVDREERPDVDRVYMSALIATTGQGGWPMSIFLTPDLKPFYAATYIRPVRHHGMPGFPDLIMKISELWQNDRDKVIATSCQITEYLQSGNKPEDDRIIDEEALENGYSQILQAYDSKYGGFGGGPKFPRPSVFNFLLRYFKRTGNGSSLKMVLNTLRAMARGGINDQIGGGFHRYSVDGQWRVPHFEKMLYDQAQLAISYLETYQITKDNSLIETAKSILDYVQDKLQHSEGGFYSAEDAESLIDISKPHEKAEGAYYIWRKSEIDSTLSKDNADIFNYFYGIAEEGNAIQDHLNTFHGLNIPHAARSVEETASAFNIPPSEVIRSLSDSREKILLEREKRPRPHLDDKIITAWNGLMISAFSKGYQIIGHTSYLDSARSAASFMLRNLMDPASQTVYRRYREGDARFDGSLQDYAFFIQGLIDLYEASFEVKWLQDAITLLKKQLELFWDQSEKGFFEVNGRDRTILVRTKEDYDGAEPAGNSVSALNLFRLSQITDNKEWHQMAVDTVQSFAYRLNTAPETMPQMLVALDWSLSVPSEIIIASDILDESVKNILAEIHHMFLPQKVILLADHTSRGILAGYLPFIKEMRPSGGRAVAYICKNYSCQMPTNDREIIRELLSR